MMKDSDHFNQRPLRRAEYIKPPNLIRAKVGTGGLAEAILNKAQKLLDNNKTDFLPLADSYLGAIKSTLEMAQDKRVAISGEPLIAAMLYPAVQLKANGGMFNYPMITDIADRMVQFLEVVQEADEEVLDIILGFYTSMRAVVVGRMQGEMNKQGEELVYALNDACVRYFAKNQDVLYNDE